MTSMIQRANNTVEPVLFFIVTYLHNNYLTEWYQRREICILEAFSSLMYLGVSFTQIKTNDIYGLGWGDFRDFLLEYPYLFTKQKIIGSPYLTGENLLSLIRTRSETVRIYKEGICLSTKIDSLRCPFTFSPERPPRSRK
jgi:hypothetical protein